MEVKLPIPILSLASLFFHLIKCFNKVLLKLILLFDSSIAAFGCMYRICTWFSKNFFAFYEIWGIFFFETFPRQNNPLLVLLSGFSSLSRIKQSSHHNSRVGCQDSGFVRMNINHVSQHLLCVLFPGDETAQVGSADCKLSPVFGALQCPHHAGRTEPEGERSRALPPVCQERGREVGDATYGHEDIHTNTNM